ncbi:MAG: hypothetical protein HY698_18020 [Deltaproteobacteria bacterium]|nr:hypothetical protein [Deltaproteobacteria bacterium]
MSDPSPSRPRVLVLESRVTPTDLARSVSTALVGAEISVHRVDLGTRAGSVAQVARALLGTSESQKLDRVIERVLPAVTVAFDPIAARILAWRRDQHLSPFMQASAPAVETVPGGIAPVLAVVPDLDPGPEWVVDADRHAVVDDEAAVALAARGLDGARLIVTGPVASRSLAEVGRQPRDLARAHFSLAPEETVLLLDMTDVPHDVVPPLLLQLALDAEHVHAVFYVGKDKQAAQLLRKHVPMHGLRAKLLGELPDMHFMWRAADLILARPSARRVHDALAAGVPLLALMPSPGHEAREVVALAERGIGEAIEKMTLVSSVLRSWLRSKERRERAAREASSRGKHDGAVLVGELALHMAQERNAVLLETIGSAQHRRNQRGSDSEEPPVGLEDLNPDVADRSRSAAPPGRGAAPSRQSSSSRAGVETPSVEDQLQRLKATVSERGKSMDAELRALKRRMEAERKGKP